MQNLNFVILNTYIVINNMSKIKNNLNNKQIFPYYNLKRRVIVRATGLFKLRNYDDDHIMFTGSQAKCIVKTDNELSKVKELYYFDDKISALDLITLGQRKFLIAGFQKGEIIVRADQNGKAEQKSQITQKYEWRFKPNLNQNFVNQIMHHPQNMSIIANCYNNGNIAIWGLLSNRRLHTFQQVHDKYTYKIRFQQPNILVSCGADCSVIRTDLERQKYISNFSHPLPVWCAHPIDKNQIATVGLFGRVFVWDTRANKVVRYCNNKRNESSFITTRINDDFKLFYGDEAILRQWDRRKSKPELLSNLFMQTSTESMLFKNDSLYTCGRGKDLCLLKGSDKLQKLTTSSFANSTTIFQLGQEVKKPLSQFFQQQLDQFDQQYQQVDNQSQSQMVDQSQPLIKTVKQQFNHPIDVVAELTIEIFKQLKQQQQKWVQSSVQPQDTNQNKQTQKEMKVALHSMKTQQQPSIKQQIKERVQQ